MITLMNVQKVIKELQKKYPGKKIIKNTEENTIEIICEIEPTKDHLNYSVAIAIIDSTISHYHQKTTEEYRVTKGILTVYKGNKSFVMHEGESIVIEPNIVHYAEGHETWIIITSRPGWTKEDYIFFT
ncbi:cupin domain-containing protein [Candidatus Roizmanbacteria bacterium]|nr:cupin domain-containing protein [Candidatus Roizmanbacteria bacterium]